MLRCCGILPDFNVSSLKLSKMDVNDLGKTNLLVSTGDRHFQYSKFQNAFLFHYLHVKLGIIYFEDPTSSITTTSLNLLLDGLR